MVRFPTLFFALLFTVTYVTAKQCTKKHPYVNLYCPIKTRYYEVIPKTSILLSKRSLRPVGQSFL